MWKMKNKHSYITMKYDDDDDDDDDDNDDDDDDDDDDNKSTKGFIFNYKQS